jgi:hypothetical protein
VTSVAKTEPSSPPTALPSTVRFDRGIVTHERHSLFHRGSSSGAGRAEALGPDAIGRQPEADEPVGHSLDECRRPAGVRPRPCAQGLEDLCEHLLVDAPAHAGSPSVNDRTIGVSSRAPATVAS